MNNIENLQAYWWLLIAVLGAALVFLLFTSAPIQPAWLTRYTTTSDRNPSQCIQR